MEGMSYQDLTVDNLFDFCAVLDAIGIEAVLGAFDKSEIAAMQQAGKDSKGVGVAITMKIAGIVIKNLPKARNEICAFFANCMLKDDGSRVTAQDLRKLKLGQFVKLIQEFFAKEDLTDFFKEVAVSLGMEPSDLTN